MLHIPKAVLDDIIEHLRATYPEEGCGLLIGKVEMEERYVLKVRLTRNTHSDRRSRYTIDPMAMFHAERGAESEGLEVFGVFHSHPDRPSEPSEHDKGTALDTFIYLIIEVSKGEPGEMRAWKYLDDKRGFVEEEIVVE